MPLTSNDIIRTSSPTYEPVPGVVVPTQSFSTANPTPSTTLPASKADGDQAILVDSTSSPTYAWLLQYSSAASAWVFLGGSPLINEIATSEGTASATYADLTTPGPSVTLPRAGTYNIEFGFECDNNAAGGIPAGAVKLGAAATADTESIRAAVGGNGQVNPSRRMKRTGLTASEVLKVQYKSSANTQTFKNRWLSVVPVLLT